MDNHGYLKVKRHQCSFNNSETFRAEKWMLVPLIQKDPRSQDLLPPSETYYIENKESIVFSVILFAET